MSSVTLADSVVCAKAWSKQVGATSSDPCALRSSTYYENECVDNPEWEDSLGDGCDWYVENDPGCSLWMDLGQLEHCPVACKSGCAQEGE